MQKRVQSTSSTAEASINEARSVEAESTRVSGVIPVDASKKKSILESVAPASGATLGSVDRFSALDVERAMRKAKEAQAQWAELSVQARVRALAKFTDALLDRAEELVTLISCEAGKPRMEALMHEVMVLASMADHYSRHASRILSPRQVEHHVFKHRRSYVHYKPRGVVAIMSPWNFPLSIPFGHAICALIAGNAVLLKPSEYTPLVARLAADVFKVCDLPDGLLQVITGGGDAGTAVVHAQPDYVIFTGRAEVGRRVAQACAGYLIPFSLEIGGKAPALVCADADLERTARAIVFGGLANNGQTCVSIERIYVVDEIHDALVERVMSWLASCVKAIQAMLGRIWGRWRLLIMLRICSA